MASASASSTTSATAGIGCFPIGRQASDSDDAPAFDAAFDPATVTATLTGPLEYLSEADEGAYEAKALNVNKAENDKVLEGFPHGKFGAEVVVLVNGGSTTTQLYDYYSGLFVGSIAGGAKRWDADLATQLMTLIASRSKPLDGTPNESTPWKGNWRPTSIVVVGAAGYKVPEGTTKWHTPSTVPTPITGWLAELPEEFAVSVLNRTKAAKIKQINCDWGSARGAESGEGITFDIGGGYSRCYDKLGRKITQWDDFRPAEKANDFLFPDGVFAPERVAQLTADIEARATRMLRAYPELTAGCQETPITLIATGNVREQHFKETAAAAAAGMPCQAL